jgi:hypothetical protein
MAAVMTSVFISYRRDDSAGDAGRLADALEARFGKARVFRDVEDIPAGEDFARAIDRALAQADTLLVVIGREWLTASNSAGRRRLDDPQDFVRLEIESALAHGIRVLPILMRGAAMPVADELPESLRPLTRIQAHELSDSRWDYDVRRLVEVLEGHSGGGGPLHKHRRLVLAAVAALVIAAGGYAWWRRTPDVSGVWYLANGNVWAVTQDGDRLTIEETHHESREVWRKGVATLHGRRVEVELDLVFERGLRYAGELQLAGDAATMTGSIALERKGLVEPVALTRQPRR